METGLKPGVGAREASGSDRYGQTEDGSASPRPGSAWQMPTADGRHQRPGRAARARGGGQVWMESGHGPMGKRSPLAPGCPRGTRCGPPGACGICCVGVSADLVLPLCGVADTHSLTGSSVMPEHGRLSTLLWTPRGLLDLTRGPVGVSSSGDSTRFLISTGEADPGSFGPGLRSECGARALVGENSPAAGTEGAHGFFSDSSIRTEHGRKHTRPESWLPLAPATTYHHLRG